MPPRELLASSQRAQFTDFTAPLDDRTSARFYTLSDNELELIDQFQQSGRAINAKVRRPFSHCGPPNVAGELNGMLPKRWSRRPSRASRRPSGSAARGRRARGWGNCREMSVRGG